MSVSVTTALSVYGNYAAREAGKPLEEITAEDLVRGLLIGRDEMNRGIVTDIVDRILCYRSAYSDEVNINYVSGDAAADATFASPACKDVRLIWKDGSFTGDIPEYLRDALRRAQRGEAPKKKAPQPMQESPTGPARTAPSASLGVFPRAVTAVVRLMLMPLKRYADFDGSSSRAEYWMWTLLQALVAIGLVAVLMPLGLQSGVDEFYADAGLWGFIAMAALVTLIYAIWIPLGALPFLAIIPLVFSPTSAPSTGLVTMAWISGAFGLLVLVPHWAVSVRRLHDRGQDKDLYVAPVGFAFLAGLILGPTGLAETVVGQIVFGLVGLIIFGCCIALWVNFVRKGDESEELEEIVAMAQILSLGLRLRAQLERDGRS